MTNRRRDMIHGQAIEAIPKWTYVTDTFFTGGDIRPQQHSGSQRLPPDRQIISPWIE